MEPQNKLEAYNRKFGAARVASMVPHMQKVGEESGIKFSYGGDISNTLLSHALVKVAQAQGKEDEVVEELFVNYFEKERAPADISMLLDVAKKTGLKDCTEDTLKNEELLQSVKREIAGVRHKFNVTGVPHFIVGNQIQLSGAQPAEYFLKVFAHLEKQAERKEAEEKVKAEVKKAEAASGKATTESKPSTASVAGSL